MNASGAGTTPLRAAYEARVRPVEATRRNSPALYEPARVLLLAPLVWVLGVAPLAYHALASIAFARRTRVPALTLVELGVMLYVLAQVVSISVAAFSGADAARLLAALYNLSFWVVGLMLLRSRRSNDPIGIRSSAIWVLLFMITIGAGGVMLYGLREPVRFPSLISLFLDIGRLPANLQDNMSLKIFGTDWSTFGVGSRLTVLAPFPTACAVLAVLVLALTVPRTWSLRSLVLFALATAGVFVITFFFSASRIATFALVVYLALLACSSLLGYVRGAQGRLAVLIVLMGLSVGAAAGSAEMARSAWVAVKESREGSSETRMQLYAHSVEKAWSTGPIVGLGVKDLDYRFAIPAGSHSTVIGAFYKSGMVGLAALGLFLAALCRESVRQVFLRPACLTVRSAGAVLLAMMPVLLFQDVDALPLVSYLFFLHVGLVLEGGEPTVGDAGAIEPTGP